MSSALLILERKKQILSLLYQDNRLVQAKVHEEISGNKFKENGNSQITIEKQNIGGEENQSSLLLGAIYIGKVKNVVSSIDAAFVEVCKGKMGFLPMKNAKNPLILNRKYDGRILAGDEILVQIEKEGIKTKDPGLTCNLSFTGKYCVLTTGKQGLGFSIKLDNKTKLYWKQKFEKWNLEETLYNEQVGMVVRTNVAVLTPEDTFDAESNLPSENWLKNEFSGLMKQKSKVLKEARFRTCFSCLFQSAEGYLTDIRDAYESSFDKILTNNEEIYRKIREAFPTMENVEYYHDTRIALEKLYSVETRLQEALDEKVWLKSGAYLIIQQTEALTVIDVNSGKIQKKNPKDDIYFEINKEAAKEIALQLKLRNLSGIIIIDFISQNSKEEDQKLLNYLAGLVKMDSVKTSVIDMTPLGLVEVTRKKINKSLKEQLKR